MTMMRWQFRGWLLTQIISFATGLVHVERNPSQPPFFKGRGRLVVVERATVLQRSLSKIANDINT
jgi:hypothetical protein